MKSSKDPQWLRIANYIIDHGSITVLDGLKMNPPITCVGQRADKALDYLREGNLQVAKRMENGRYMRWYLVGEEKAMTPRRNPVEFARIGMVSA